MHTFKHSIEKKGPCKVMKCKTKNEINVLPADTDRTYQIANDLFKWNSSFMNQTAALSLPSEEAEQPRSSILTSRQSGQKNTETFNPDTRNLTRSLEGVDVNNLISFRFYSVADGFGVVCVTWFLTVPKSLCPF